MYREKNVVYIGIATIHSFRHPLGDLGTYTLWKRGDYCTTNVQHSEPQWSRYT